MKIESDGFGETLVSGKASKLIEETNFDSKKFDGACFHCRITGHKKFEYVTGWKERELKIEICSIFIYFFVDGDHHLVYW